MNDLQILPRHLLPALEGLLREVPVVVLTGARQTGKTTLARAPEVAAGRAFRTLDDLRVLELAEREPDLLVSEAPRMTIDEVQRAPDLLRAVKRAVDSRREPGRFLLTGSANLLLLGKVSETLAGRAIYIELGPLTESEKASAPPPPITTLMTCVDAEAARACLSERSPVTDRPWAEIAAEGGYPPVLPLSAAVRARWFDSYVASYLERDVRQLSAIASLADFRRLVEVAALRVGGIVNQADIARDAGLSRPTAHRYLNLLEASCQLRRLRPYRRSRTARLVKSPKLYWTDTGLALHLAGLHTPHEVEAAPRSGVFLENLLLAHLDGWRETVAPRPEISYYRTAGGVEVDFVLERGRSVLPIEVKAAASVRRSDARGLEQLLADEPRARFGLLAHLGSEVSLLTKTVVAAPLFRLL